MLLGKETETTQENPQTSTLGCQVFPNINVLYCSSKLLKAR